MVHSLVEKEKRKERKKGKIKKLKTFPRGKGLVKGEVNGFLRPGSQEPGKRPGKECEQV